LQRKTIEAKENRTQEENERKRKHGKRQETKVEAAATQRGKTPDKFAIIRLRTDQLSATWQFQPFCQSFRKEKGSCPDESTVSMKLIRFKQRTARKQSKPRSQEYRDALHGTYKGIIATTDPQ
jgi:hypothetical protein